jgi:TPR repeat protein
LSADHGDADAQLNYGVMLFDGAGLLKNKSLAAYYFKLSADQGNSVAQLNYGLLLSAGDVILKNKSLSAQDFTLSVGPENPPGDLLYIIADEGNTATQERSGIPPEEIAIAVNEMDEEAGFAEFEQGIRLPGEQGLDHLRISADVGVATAEFHYQLRLDELLSDL